jgi:Tol biopolymer transport system component
MNTKLSKLTGWLCTALVMVFTMLGGPSNPAQAGAPAAVYSTRNSNSTSITSITRVSLDSSGGQGNNGSGSASISADGRYVAFISTASNLVSGDTNGTFDIFERDTQTGTTIRVSVDSSGAQANGWSEYPCISADGRYAAFQSTANNLVSGDTNGVDDIFVRDTQSGTTRRVSVDSSGAQGNNASYSPALSADGRYVAFVSDADNLVSGDTNDNADVFLHDTQTGATTRISVDSSGVQGNGYTYTPISISADGLYVVFSSDADNLVSGDTNGRTDIFLHDMQTGTTKRVSLDSSGTQANNWSGSPSVSADGNYVVFQSYATNLVSGDTNGKYDTFLHDIQTGTTRRVSLDSSGTQGNDHSYSPSISNDGRYVAFYSDASNLVSGDTNGKTDVFLSDTQTGSTARVSLDASGGQGNGNSKSPSMSGDGHFVAFESTADNLVSGDTNVALDVFVVPVKSFNLTVSKTGAGSGTITSVPGGINCGSTCSSSYLFNTIVTLTAAPASGSAFTGWSGSGCSGTGTCTVTMSAVQSVTADFRLNAYTLSVSKTGTGSGTVTSSPAGIDCGATCSASFNYNASVTLNVTAASGSTFTGWSGSGCYGTGTCTVTMSAARTMAANFTLGPVYLLTVSKIGTGSGTITSSPAGMICGPVCAYAFAADTSIILTAKPASTLSYFTGWSGSGCSGTGTCKVTMSAAKSVTASFNTAITRVSVDSSGTQGNGGSLRASISVDGRYVAFSSIASNLISGDTNGVQDIFLRDTQTGTTTRVSVDSSGVQGNGGSASPVISADGRYVAFVSDASNLVSGDTNVNADIFLHDTQTGTTIRVSVDSSGAEGNAWSQYPCISADGRYVAFESWADNLVSEESNGSTHIYLHDTQSGTTERVSVNSSGVQGNGMSSSPAISADGRYVAFISDATNLVSGDTNSYYDVFLRDTHTGITTRVSVDSSGAQENAGSGFYSSPAISANGRYVAFSSDSSNLVSGDTNSVNDIFLHDTQTGTTRRISVSSNGAQANAMSYNPSISADGRYVTFDSEASNLVNGDTSGFDVFLRDTQTGTTRRLSVDASGKQGNGLSLFPSISADGRYAAFESIASNLVSGDTNGESDVFVVPAASNPYQVFLPRMIR